MRLFAAIVPPEPVLAELTPVIRPLQELAPALRWTSQPSWHFTLAFLAEVPDRVLPELSTRLERAAGRHPSLRLAITGGGAFPTASRARVLWAGLSGDTVALSVTRSPSTKSLLILSRDSIWPICGPPPCTTIGFMPTCFRSTMSSANMVPTPFSPIAWPPYFTTTVAPA